jgi:LCP family protein required for cell wall assembly
MNGFRYLPRRRSWLRQHPIVATFLLVVVALSAGAGATSAPGAAAPAGAEQLDPKPMTILLMGVDAREGESIDIGVRPDALAVLRLEPESGSCRLLNIPRDSRVNLPGYGFSKINHALSVGGIPYQELVVEEFLGISIDRYALIDFGGAEVLVDAVGGVTITVTEPFEQNSVLFEVGERTLDGTEALAYASYRGGPDGDFGRIRRQQQLVRAILAKGPSLDPVTLVRELLPQLEDHVRTDLSPLDLLALGSKFIDTCTDETLVTMNLEGGVATYDDPLYGVPLSYVVIAEDEVRRNVGELIAAA